MIKRIVLTGGPCAGKTTALAKIEQDLKEKGYRVFIVPESATELIKSGISPIDKDGIGLFEFQKTILLYQYQKEEFYNEVASKFKDEKIVIIYDRGLMDNKAYVPDDRFKEILDYSSKKLNKSLTELDIASRYDMVIHLVTSAEGDAKNYTLENNNARIETAMEARVQDKKALESWAKHDNLKIVGNYEKFDEKIDKVLSIIHNCLDNTVLIKKERKFLVDNIDFDELFENIKFEKCYITQYYIDAYMDNISTNNKERRLRKVIYGDVVDYYDSSYIREENGVKKIEWECKLSKNDFEKIIYNSKIISEIKKKRYTFVYDRQYFKLDIFENFSMLEIRQMSENNELNIPDGIELIKEVTNNIDYQNINLGNEKTKKLARVYNR